MVRASDHDERLSILGFTDPLFDRLLAHLPEEERLATMHVVDVAGRVHSGGEGLLMLLSLNRRTRWRARAARMLPPVRRKVARQYRAIADRRDELSETVPDVEPTIVSPRWTSLDDDNA